VRRRGAVGMRWTVMSCDSTAQGATLAQGTRQRGCWLRNAAGVVVGEVSPHPCGDAPRAHTGQALRVTQESGKRWIDKIQYRTTSGHFDIVNACAEGRKSS